MQKGGLPTNTKRFFNLVVALGVTLLVIWVFVMSQTEMGNSDYESYTPEQKARVDSIRQALGRDEVAQRPDPTDNMWGNMVIVLILLGGGLAALWWWNRGNPEVSNASFNIVAEFEVGPGQTVKIVDMNGEYWVLGVAGNGITLLEKWTEEQWQQRKPQTPSMGTGSGQASFAQMLNRFKSTS
jgi:flagellar biogenesis protein FliO